MLRTIALLPIFRHPKPQPITRRKNGINARRYGLVRKKNKFFKIGKSRGEAVRKSLFFAEVAKSLFFAEVAKSLFFAEVAKSLFFAKVAESLFFAKVAESLFFAKVVESLFFAKVVESLFFAKVAEKRSKMRYVKTFSLELKTLC